MTTRFSVETLESKGVWRQELTFSTKEAAKNYAQWKFPFHGNWRIRQFCIEDKSDNHLETT